MAGEQEEITEERIIVLPGGGDGVDEPEPKKPQEDGPDSDDPDAGLTELKAQLEKEKENRRLSDERADRESRQRAEAERRAGAANAQVREASTAATSAQHDSIVNALESAKSVLAALKRDYTAAMEAGEFGKAADIQGDMSLAGARQVSLENGKRAIEEQMEAAKKAPPARDQPSVTDRQEEFLRAIPATSAQWIRAHPQYFSDARFKTKVDAAAAYLEQVEGITYENPDYYTRIEQATGLREKAAPADGDVSSAAATVTERASPANGTKPAAQKPAQRVVPAAAPSRTVPNSTGNGNGKISVTLSPEERQVARLTLTPEIIGVDPVTKLPRDPEVVFAQRKQEAIAAGRRW